MNFYCPACKCWYELFAWFQPVCPDCINDPERKKDLSMLIGSGGGQAGGGAVKGGE